MSIEVLNGRRDGFIGPDRVYVGRWNSPHKLRSSPLANPYTIGKDGTREEVIEAYQAWLLVQINNESPGVMNELKRIAALAKASDVLYLTCWCKPEGCHADIIKLCVEWILAEESSSDA